MSSRVVLHPKPVDDAGFTVEPDPSMPDTFIVRGDKPERWVRQTQFTNDEAVGYLADRLARLGVEGQLAKLGAEPGATVTIGDVSFEWEPTVEAGANFTPGGRGTDHRLELHDRPTPADRLAARRIRRGEDVSIPAVSEK